MVGNNMINYAEFSLRVIVEQVISPSFIISLPLFVFTPSET